MGSNLNRPPNLTNASAAHGSRGGEVTFVGSHWGGLPRGSEASAGAAGRGAEGWAPPSRQGHGVLTSLGVCEEAHRTARSAT